MDLIDDGPSNAPEFSVSELSGAVKRVIEGEFGRVRVRGEIGRVTVARSGHVYFDLKDDRSVLSAVAWKGQAARLTARPEEGLEMIATGRMTTFGSQSRYQITVDDLRPAGVGALMAMLEERKRKLAAEGLFAAERKRPLPYLPNVIGVVTSPQGAVIRDILHRLKDRFPRHVLVWPVAVQGRDCADQVARAIAGFNALTPGGELPRPDVLIVARGGGSIEDLWGFNEEAVARAAAASDIPLISAVGHETDTTLIDHAADRRAPTPTAAAEIAVPVRLDLLTALDGHGARLGRGIAQAVTSRRQRLADLTRALPRVDELTGPARQRLDIAETRLPAALLSAVAARRTALVEMAAVLRPRALGQSVAERRGRLETMAGRLAPALARAGRDRSRALGAVAPRLTDRSVRRRIAQGHDRLGGVGNRLDRAASERLAELRLRMSALERLLETLSHRETLRRGYAVVWSGGRVITSAAAARGAASLEIEFGDGRIDAAAGGKPRTGKRRPPPPDQGKLL